jgi:adenylate cyclase
MGKILDSLLGKKLSGTRVVSLAIKIVAVFTIMMLVSNFASNYINLMMNRGELVKLMNQLLIKDLKSLYNFSSNQYDIYQFSQNYDDAVSAIEKSAAKDLKEKKSIAIGIKQDGSLMFQASNLPKLKNFTDATAFAKMGKAFTSEANSDSKEGILYFRFDGAAYFGVYKYIDKWNVVLLRAEELNEFYSDSQLIFLQVSMIIIIITLLSAIIGTFLIRFILRYVNRISEALMKMQTSQKMELIDIGGAPNDEVSYLGASFNALSSTIDNLMTIFRKFVTQDVAQRAYREHEIRLEGTQKELTILFTDIKSFTYMTETLGNDIINLLNLHYDRAIKHIHHHDGIVGSIIGDALLAVYGTLPEEQSNKSLAAIKSAYEIQDVAASLRTEMTARKEEIVRTRGSLTEAEDRVYRACLLEVGVGIDGGQVFYGNIGSYERMTNTVIGDNVNSASRLEGLTRIYKLPVIVSDFVREESVAQTDEYEFLEIDLVQVKGKTEGKRIFWPIEKGRVDAEFRQDIDRYAAGLAAYYEGDWRVANGAFTECRLAVAEIFRERTKSLESPKEWNGIWTMTTK